MKIMEPFLGFNRNVWKFAIPTILLAVLLYFFGLWIPAALVGVLVVYLFLFFRDPERKAPNIPNSLTSPADGKVVSVLEVPCDDMEGGRAIRVAIFLNIFNVHVQRMPIAGQVYRIDHRPGKAGNALNEKCSEENEAVTVWLKSDFGPIGVRQISGAIARRIICKAIKGISVERGDRYGIIQFGSRVELFLPLNATVKVQPGQIVKGGTTCLAVVNEDDVRRGLSSPNIEKPDFSQEAAS